MAVLIGDDSHAAVIGTERFSVRGDRRAAAVAFHKADMPSPSLLVAVGRRAVPQAEPHIAHLDMHAQTSWCRVMRHSSGCVTDGSFLWRTADGTLKCL